MKELQETLYTMAESLAPALTLHGRGEPMTLPVDPEAYAVMLDTRLQVEWALAHEARHKRWNMAEWTYADGLYSGYDNRGDSVSVKNYPFSRNEQAVTHHIDQSLETGEAPVVALDFGGGMGLSWLRIAMLPKYRAAIEASQLAMVVTNLGSAVTRTPIAEGTSGVAAAMEYINSYRPEYTNADVRWAQKAQAYAQYLDANALELGGMAVDLPNGARLPLRGNVAVIHERLALGHTHVPDLALLSFNALLHNTGVLRSRAARYYHRMHPPLFSEIPGDNGRVIPITQEYVDQRNLGLAIGSRALQQKGFSHEVDNAIYTGVFVRLPSSVKMEL